MARDRDDLLTTTPAGVIIGIKPDTVRSLVRRGRLDAIRTPSGQYLFRRRDCEREAERRAQGRDRKTRIRA
jgi:predicted site-specific integrase-resolvase